MMKNMETMKNRKLRLRAACGLLAVLAAAVLTACGSSGTGGQNDFAEGASYSKGGRSVICVKATKKNNTISSIVAQHATGSVVTLSRNTVDYIITEYGIAPMRGRSVRQRVENLIAVAHPDFRAELRKQADELHLW